MTGKRPRDSHTPQSPSPHRTRTGTRGRSAARGANQTEETPRVSWDEEENIDPEVDVVSVPNQEMAQVNVTEPAMDSEQSNVTEQGVITEQVNESERSNVNVSSQNNNSNIMVTESEQSNEFAQNNSNIYVKLCFHQL